MTFIIVTKRSSESHGRFIFRTGIQSNEMRTVLLPAWRWFKHYVVTVLRRFRRIMTGIYDSSITSHLTMRESSMNIHTLALALLRHYRKTQIPSCESENIHV